MTAKLFCRLTLLKIIPLFGKTKFSQLTGTKTKSLFLLLPFGRAWVAPRQWLSDHRSHSRGCVVFLEHIIKQLLNENITALHIWPDGPNSQFKNPYIAATLSWLQRECSVEITWHLFTSSHGKGPVHGIGGAIKRLATTEVIKRKAIITDHLSFFKAVRDISTIKVFNITADEANQRINTSELKAIIDNAPPLRGIFSAHCLKLENGLVKMSQYSDQINQKVVKDESPINDDSTSVQIGSFAIIPYEFQISKSTVTKNLVAVVTNVKQDTLEVQYMSAISKQRFKICSNDKGIASQKSVLQILPCPPLKRDIYHFNDELDVDMI